MTLLPYTKHILPNGRGLRSYCKETNVNYDSCIYCILNYGYSPEKAYEYVTHREPRPSIFIETTGETVKQFCDRIGINAVGFYYYTKKKGWTKEETYKYLVKKYLGKES